LILHSIDRFASRARRFIASVILLRDKAASASSKIHRYSVH
jgi:hypothetical protein